MKIEFFTSEDFCHNARSPGEVHASNEAIFGIFYDYPSEFEAKLLFDDIEKVLQGKIEKAEFGDSVDGELNAKFAILRADDVKSKVYKLKTTDLKQAIEKWLEFRKREEPNIVETISLDVEVIAYSRTPKN